MLIFIKEKNMYKIVMLSFSNKNVLKFSSFPILEFNTMNMRGYHYLSDTHNYLSEYRYENCSKTCSIFDLYPLRLFYLFK